MRAFQHLSPWPTPKFWATSGDAHAGSALAADALVVVGTAGAVASARLGRGRAPGVVGAVGVGAASLSQRRLEAAATGALAAEALAVRGTGPPRPGRLARAGTARGTGAVAALALAVARARPRSAVRDHADAADAHQAGHTLAVRRTRTVARGALWTGTTAHTGARSRTRGCGRSPRAEDRRGAPGSADHPGTSKHLPPGRTRRRPRGRGTRRGRVRRRSSGGARSGRGAASPGVEPVPHGGVIAPPTATLECQSPVRG